MIQASAGCLGLGAFRLKVQAFKFSARVSATRLQGLGCRL